MVLVFRTTSPWTALGSKALRVYLPGDRVLLVCTFDGEEAGVFLSVVDERPGLEGGQMVTHGSGALRMVPVSVGVGLVGLSSSVMVQVRVRTVVVVDAPLTALIVVEQKSNTGRIVRQKSWGRILT